MPPISRISRISRTPLFLVTAHMPKTPREPRESDQILALRLDQLFATHLDPVGKPYSVRQVAERTGMSASYLSGLRRGKVTGPGADKVEALARFFGVDMAYFMGSERVELPATTAGDDRLRKALENPLVREIAITTGDFNREQWDHMLAILEHQVEIQRIADERARQKYERQAAAERPPRDIASGRPRQEPGQARAGDTASGDGDERG
jgi:transcriptional regulator with XRE-family HTH domain